MNHVTWKPSIAYVLWAMTRDSGPLSARHASHRTQIALGKSSFERPIFFDSAAAFGKWLSANHASKTEVFLGNYKKHTGKQAMTWSESVDEALSWGWIDGQKKAVDANRTAQRFTPRAKKSHWSRVNVDKVAVLEAAGRMHDPGRTAFAQRTEENTAQMSFERTALVLTGDFSARLAKIRQHLNILMAVHLDTDVRSSTG
ncbi:hypothetical protein BJ170DRAFT_624062 [Xylariales sp. AK1849]|nr:hypothetical protein BJ170DRAFT_624062 [Xylariales sp. AK1849]